jgi:hypothetical protein
MALDPSDLLDLYGGDADLARARADVMARRAQGLQGAGLLLHTLAGDRDPAGAALAQMGQSDANQITQAIAARPQYQAHALAAQRAQEEENAWQSPEATKLLRGAVQQFMPGLGVEETTPVAVLRNIAPMAERYGQSYAAIMGRNEHQKAMEDIARQNLGLKGSEVTVSKDLMGNPIVIRKHQGGLSGRIAAGSSPAPGGAAAPAPDSSSAAIVTSLGGSAPSTPTMGAAPTAIGSSPGQAAKSLTGPDAIAEAIIEGNQPPDTKGLFRMAGPVRVALAQKGFNLAAAQSDWAATQKHLATLNGPQQTRLMQSITTAQESLGNIDKLYNEWKQLGGATGSQLFNKGALAVAKQLPGRPGEVARALEMNIADLTAELGNVYMGGNSPTDHALGLAQKNLSADWNEGQFREAIDQARKNIQYRVNSIKNSSVVGASAGNKYAPSQAAEPTTSAPVRKSVGGKTYEKRSDGWYEVNGG